MVGDADGEVDAITLDGFVVVGLKAGAVLPAEVPVDFFVGWKPLFQW